MLDSLLQLLSCVGSSVVNCWLGRSLTFFFFWLIDQDQLQFTSKVKSALPQNKEQNFLAGPGCPLMKTFRKDSDKTVSGVCKWRHTGKAGDSVKKCYFLCCTSYIWPGQEGGWSWAFPVPVRRNISAHSQTNCAGSASLGWPDCSNQGWLFLPLYCTCFALLGG